MTEVNIAYKAICDTLKVAASSGQEDSGLSKQGAPDAQRWIRVGNFLFTEHLCAELVDPNDPKSGRLGDFCPEFIAWMSKFASALDVKLFFEKSLSGPHGEQIRVRCSPKDRTVAISESVSITALNLVGAVLRVFVRDLQDELRGELHFQEKLERLFTCCGFNLSLESQEELTASCYAAENLLISKSAVVFLAEHTKSEDKGAFGWFRSFSSGAKAWQREWQAVSDPKTPEDAGRVFNIHIRCACRDGRLNYLNQLRR